MGTESRRTGLRWHLRQETRSRHDAADALGSDHDLGTLAGYRGFLRAHARALPALEAACDAAGLAARLPDWPRRRRAAALAADLAALGVAAPDSPPLAFAGVEEALGAAYVLEGSRLGNAMLLRQAAALPEARGATAYRPTTRGREAGRPSCRCWSRLSPARTSGPRRRMARARPSTTSWRPCVAKGPLSQCCMREDLGDLSLTQAVDLTNCDREPIHLLGGVQPIGFLVAVTSDWVVRRTSANIEAHLGRAPEALFGSFLSRLLTREALHQIGGRLHLLRGPNAVERLFGVVLQEGQPPYDLAIHMAGEMIVLEGEPSDLEDALEAGTTVRGMIARLHQVEGFDGLCREAVRQIRALTGFGRVMLYRFDHDGAGEVIAESTASFMPSFMGLHFPASDIPRRPGCSTSATCCA
ncbi:hypothetical protein [Teichococcus aestuarii]|uniref:hypothetical protein n=1 Tax=Teichococcus aestuarii TaxID=568898 RepID=UPI003609D0C8